MANHEGKRRFQVALVQMSMSVDVKENEAKAYALVEKAARQGGRVICLPELYRSRYFCQTENAGHFDLAESEPGESVRAFQELARAHGVVVVVPVFERRAAGIYHNSVIVIDADGRVLGSYRKMHIPDDPGYYEKYYFTPGDLGFRVFHTAFGTIAALICWDQWYPEAARLAVLGGASVLLYPTAIGWHPYEKAAYGATQLEAWRTVQRGHAIANGAYVAAANRTGFEPPLDANGAGIEFWGASFVSDPQGVILAQAGHEEEDVIIAEVDMEHLEMVRRNWPFLRDRRIDAYHGIMSRYLDD